MQYSEICNLNSTCNRCNTSDCDISNNMWRSRCIFMCIWVTFLLDFTLRTTLNTHSILFRSFSWRIHRPECEADHLCVVPSWVIHVAVLQCPRTSTCHAQHGYDNFKFLRNLVRFIHSFSSLSHNRSKTSSKASFHIVRSRASSFICEYRLLSLRSSSSVLLLLPRFPVTSIPPFLFPSITCHRRPFLRKMWSIQLATRLHISYGARGGAVVEALRYKP
jgi:hypothetical protein